MKNIPVENIVYSDETGIDDNEVTRTGWAKRGKRCFAQKKANRSKRYNIIAALSMNCLFAPFIFEGHSDTITYETYIERVLIPAMKPGMVLIIDNARFHKSEKIIQLVEAIGCKILFLPPYSPDLNPIEHYWTAIKNAIRSAATVTNNFYEAAIQTLATMCTP